jgi:hypothetical protein
MDFKAFFHHSTIPAGTSPNLYYLFSTYDLCHSQIEYFRNAIDLDRKDRATRGASACAA